MSFLLPKPKPKRRTIHPRPQLKRRKQCVVCGKEFDCFGRHVGKYCSRQCYRSVKLPRPAWVTVECAQCGTAVQKRAVDVKRVKRVFCSQPCSGKFYSGEQHPAFRGHGSSYRGGSWRKLREEIIKRDGYQCRRCGAWECRTTRRLSVDHVRPFHSFEDKALANHPDNLVALCGKCHSFKTTTVEAAWMRGDVLAWKQWVASLHLESAVKFGWSA